jgi:uncharacterized protein YaaW (UPF0174 family)
MPFDYKRRQVVLLCSSAVFPARNVQAAQKKPIASAARFVFPKIKWGTKHFPDFVVALPPEARLTLSKSMGLLKESQTVDDLKSPNATAKEMQKRLLWLSSNVLAYPFKDPDNLNYHSLVTWVAKKAGVDRNVNPDTSTFQMERELYRALFVSLWEKLSPKKREELLDKIDQSSSIKDKSGIAAMSGAAALATLSATVAFTGFAFYTTMSIAIATVAGAVGVTLPMAVYTSAASLVGILAGPVGWAIMSVTALGGIALSGRANVQKTTQAIMQVHALKVEALLADRIPKSKVF